MPTSLRLPVDVENQLSDYVLRAGVSKSAVIVRSIEAYLAERAQPSAYDLYVKAMDEADRTQVTQQVAIPNEQRPHKLAYRAALRVKYAARSARAVDALAALAARTPAKPRKTA